MRDGQGHTISAISADEGRTASGGIPAEVIHSQLDRIVESAHFRGSLRLTRFLKFAVETALAGRPERIKAYTIAVEALGRGCDFDPQHDPIVRVEAGRLRQALTRYYAEAGTGDPLLIELPRGTYVPVFRRREAAQTPPQARANLDARPPRARSGLAENFRQFEWLNLMVRRQSNELLAEVRIARGLLAESRALLQQPLTTISSHPAPPLSPSPMPINLDEKQAESESVAAINGTFDPLWQQKLLQSGSERTPAVHSAAKGKLHFATWVSLRSRKWSLRSTSR